MPGVKDSIKRLIKGNSFPEILITAKLIIRKAKLAITV
jgi:hypothetical protein